MTTELFFPRISGCAEYDFWAFLEKWNIVQSDSHKKTLVQIEVMSGEFFHATLQNFLLLTLLSLEKKSESKIKIWFLEYFMSILEIRSQLSFAFFAFRATDVYGLILHLKFILWFPNFLLVFFLVRT